MMSQLLIIKEGLKMKRQTGKRWVDRPMRIGALQCNFEGGREQTLAVTDTWRKLGINVEQLFHPCADSYSALFNEEQHGEILRAYLDRARSRQMRVILYLNVHTIGPSLAQHAATWAQQCADGSFPLLYDTYYATCYNSPWSRHFFEMIDSLANYPIDGIFLDGPVITSDGCHCRFCREQHRAWFGTGMGDGPTSFDFNRKTLETFLQETYQRFKKTHPEGVVYQNLGVDHARASHIDMRKTLTLNDIIGSEGGFMFYGPPAADWPWRPGYTARLLEALGPEKPRVVFMAADQKPWSWYIHQPGETVACIASCAANGSNIWYGLHSSTKMLDSPGGKAAARMFRFLQRHEAVYDGAVSAADVAVFYSYETDSALNQASGGSDLYGEGETGAGRGLGDHKRAAKGFADMLIRSHIPFDLVTDLDLNPEVLKQYRCVILPSAVCMSDAVADVLDAYVRAGGRLIATFSTSLVDEKGVKRRDFALADAFGVHAQGRVTTYGAYNYMVPRGRHAVLRRIDVPYMPMAGEAIDVRATEEASVLLDFLKPMAGRYEPLTPPDTPAAVLNRHGRGACLYLAGAFGEHYMTYTPPEYRQLAANAVKQWSRAVVELRGAPSSVELVVRRQPDRLIIHLINGCSLNGRPIVHVAPLFDLKLFIRTTSPAIQVRALVSKTNLPAHAVARGQEVTLPVLNAHETIVVTL